MPNPPENLDEEDQFERESSNNLKLNTSFYEGRQSKSIVNQYNKSKASESTTGLSCLK